MKNLLLALLWQVPFWVYAQIVPANTGAKSCAMAHANLSDKSVWATAYNPSLLYEVDSLQVGLNYANHFLIKELSVQSIAIASSIKSKHGLGIQYHFAGNQLYQRQVLGVSYGINLSKVLSVGAELLLNQHRFIEPYQNKVLPSAGVSFTYKVDRNWNIQGVVHNISQSNDKEMNVHVPVNFQLGTSYSDNKHLTIACNYSFLIQHGGNLKIGFNYSAHTLANFRLGVNTNPVSLGFGYGLETKRVILDFGSMYQFSLGFSPQIGLRCRI